jgi:uncharacterized lipoprotein YmbA
MKFGVRVGILLNVAVRVRSSVHALSVAMIAGCGAVPTQNYYVLTPVAVTAAAGAASKATAGITILVDPAHVPDAVDRPQLVISDSDNKVTILEQQRWAEPLRAAIPQVIALDLATELDGARVSVASSITGDDTFRLSLDVQRFESRPGAQVAIEIAWTLRHYVGNAGTNATKSGRSSAREPVAGGDYDAIASAHSRALATISRDIAAAIRTSSSAQTPR